ncbi:tyrosine-type recombinase/integrase [Dehalogenimonas etheniformans]|uniref:Site-specific integrase n=1 Tax=Dehalogenimonas etheniformans TaxID=1536648 RepID=A0A2P5P4Z2_9CHLR|nr:site-specific integrase [Dehalogenimonas etheniformans]PPD57360.1 site-specific integrase [Dehalogenimonas etheniformans]QNT75210.1 site-specific integrase [Dehalogenimonas etheniformans]
MRGYIRSKGKQSWQIILDTGQGPGGKRQRHYETVRGRRSDAQRRLNDLLVSLDKGTYSQSGRLTVADHFQNWLKGYVKTNCSPRTLDGYQSIIDVHLIPALGSIKLKQLHPQSIQAYYGKACESLSARTVHHHHRVLFQSLKYAVRQGYLGRNPAELVDPPAPRKKTMRTLTPGEVEVLLESAQSSHYYPVIYMALSSGLRQAELLGLRWRDLDLDFLSISVNQVLYKRRGVCLFKEPKTAHSRRRVSMTPKLAIFLRGYRAQREELYADLKQKLGLDALVFTGIEGRPVDPCSLTHAFTKLVKGAGLEGVRFHDLRHTFSSLMLLRGAKPKVISEALGHSSVAFTMDVYSHIISGMQEDAMALLDGVLPAGVVKNSVAKMSPTLQKLALSPCSSVG